MAGITAVVTVLVTGVVSETSAANGGTLEFIRRVLESIDSWVLTNLTWLAVVALAPLAIYVVVRAVFLVRERRLPFSGEILIADDLTRIVFAMVWWGAAAGTLLMVRTVVDSSWPSIVAVTLFVVGAIRIGDGLRRLFLP